MHLLNALKAYLLATAQISHLLSPGAQEPGLQQPMGTVA